MFTEIQYPLVSRNNAEQMRHAATYIIDALLINLKHSNHLDFASDCNQLHNLKWAKDFIAHCDYVALHGVSKEVREREKEIAKVKF